MATAKKPPDKLAASLRHQQKSIDEMRASARMRARLMKTIPKPVEFPRSLVEVTNPGPSGGQPPRVPPWARAWTLVSWKNRLCRRPIRLGLDLLHRIEIGSAALLEIAEPEYARAQLRKPASLRQSETTDLLGGLFFAPGLDILPIMPAVPLPVGPMLHLVNPVSLHGVPPSAVHPGG